MKYTFLKVMDSPTLLGFSFVILIIFLPCTISNPSLFTCDSVFECGNITASFPFWGEDRGEPCGHPYLNLTCDKVSNKTSLTISNISYDVHHIDNKFNTLRLVRKVSSTSFCSVPFIDMKLSPDVFELSPSYKNHTVFYNCNPRFRYLKNFTCSKGVIGSVYQSKSYYKSCQTFSNIVVPVGFRLDKETGNLTTLESVLRKGFIVKLKIDERPCQKCLSSGGTCGFDKFGRQFCCRESLKDEINTIKCSIYSDDDDDVLGNVLMMVSGVSLLAIFIGSLIASVIEHFLEKIEALQHPRIENFDELIPLKRYSYAEVKEITNSFAQEIGRGGFGIVYRGNISDGLKVAVKVLKESNRSGEDFINEVVSMSRTSHVHIVSLLGFCYEFSKRAIIYEFVENGSLDKFISSEASLRIDLRKMYEISLGVARGLQYLHYACKTRIVHFDIKPQNILLGKDLCPKISDFGLARLCGSKESVLWMSQMRGTIGYIAPEMFSRMFGTVSHKSDVYSYGMLVLEMIGARKRNYVSNNSNSSLYFPDWIYKDLEKKDCKRLLSDEITEDEDEDFAKKMVLVGLSCIQACPTDRPSMNRVVEMMEGSLSTLEVPPKSLLQLSSSPILPPSCSEEENSISSQV